MHLIQSGLVAVLFLWNLVPAGSIRLVEMRVPAHVAAGGEALLGCQYDLDGVELYSVKWYKDGREFYRYIPSNKHQVAQFPAKGVHVDMHRSYNDVVTLVALERESEGLYRCEVSGEGPLFATVADEKYVTVHVLPETGPRAIGLKTQYRFGEKVISNCTSSASKPEAQLKWLINNKTIPQHYLHGSWKRVGYPPDTIVSVLQLKFTVKPIHFLNKVMEIKCQATIAPLYHQETSHTITNPDLTPPDPDPAYEDPVEKAEPDLFNFPDLSSHHVQLPLDDRASESDQEDEPDAATKTSTGTLALFLSVEILMCTFIVLNNFMVIF